MIDFSIDTTNDRYFTIVVDRYEGYDETLITKEFDGIRHFTYAQTNFFSAYAMIINSVIKECVYPITDRLCRIDGISYYDIEYPVSYRPSIKKELTCKRLRVRNPSKHHMLSEIGNTFDVRIADTFRRSIKNNSFAKSHTIAQKHPDIFKLFCLEYGTLKWIARINNTVYVDGDNRFFEDVNKYHCHD